MTYKNSFIWVFLACSHKTDTFLKVALIQFTNK